MLFCRVLYQFDTSSDGIYSSAEQHRAQPQEAADLWLMFESLYAGSSAPSTMNQSPAGDCAFPGLTADCYQGEQMLCIDLPISSCKSFTKRSLVRRWEGGEVAAEDKKSSTIPLITHLKIALFETMKTDRLTTTTTHFPFPEHVSLGIHELPVISVRSVLLLQVVLEHIQ